MKIFILVFFLEIKSVIFYQNSAQVKDERIFKCEKGLNTFEIILNPFVLEGSIKAKIENGKILSIDIIREKFEKPVYPLKNLKDSLDKLNSLKNIYENEKEGIKNAIDFLKSFRVAYSEKVGKEYLEKPFEYQKISQTVDYLLKENKELGKEVIDVEKKLKEINEEIKKIENKINEIKPIGEEGVKLKIVCEAYSEALKIILDYIIRERCGWNSFYEIYALPDEEKIKIIGYANVENFTGEDFKNVKISLSTGKPMIGIKPPEIVVWQIFPPRIPVAKELEAERKMFIPASAEEKFLTINYEIKEPVTIPSRKEPIPVFYIEEKLPSKFLYYTYPRTFERVYFQGKILNKSEKIFINGRANLYVEDEYIGESYLENFVPGDSIDIYFGEDPEVKVKREKKVHEVYKKGIIKKETVHHLEYETSLKNFRKRDIEIILIEQVPVSYDPNVRIENVKFSEKPFEIDEAKGTYKFKLNLKKNEEFKLKFEFDIILEKEDIRIEIF
jgi:hypothetical protein